MKRLKVIKYQMPQVLTVQQIKLANKQIRHNGFAAIPATKARYIVVGFGKNSSLLQVD